MIIPVENLIDKIPEGKFVSSVSNKTIKEILTFLLTPIYGKSVLETIYLVQLLDSYGKQLVNNVRYQTGNSDISMALLYVKRSMINYDGQNCPLCDPYLLFSNDSRIPNQILAKQKFSLESDGNIKISPGRFNIISRDLSFHAHKQLKAESNFMYSQSGEKHSIDPLVLMYPGDINLSGDQGVETKACLIRSKNIEINSKKGNIVDNSMSLDLQYASIDDSTAIQESRGFSSFFYAENAIIFNSEYGKIEQTGTKMLSGTGGIKFSSNLLKMDASYDHAINHKADNRTFTKYETKTAHPTIISTKGSIDFNSKTIVANGTQIEANSVINKENGNIFLNAASNSISISSQTRRAGTFGGGVSTRNDFQSKSVPKPVNIDAKNVEFTGNGKMIFEGTNIKKPDMIVTKDLIEKTPNSQLYSKTTSSGHGFFPPKIKGDPMLDSLKSMNKSINAADMIPNAISTASVGLQTLDHFKSLTNLASIPNPGLALSQILLSRFVSGFGYYNMKQTIESKEINPVQSNVELGSLKIDNKEIHIEGKWKVDRAEINTEKFSAVAPKYKFDQSVKTEDYCVSFSPVSLFGSMIIPVTALTKTVSLIPNFMEQKGSSSAHLERNIPATFHANEFYLRCDDAVLSGAQIQADLIDAIVKKKLSVENLTSLADSDEKRSCICANLASIGNISNDINSKMNAVPYFRSEKCKKMAQKIDAIAEIVGKKKFYLNAGKLIYTECSEIGLEKVDNSSEKSRNEVIISDEIEKKIVHEFYEEKNKVINPCIAEISMLRCQLEIIKQNSSEFEENDSKNNNK